MARYDGEADGRPVNICDDDCVFPSVVELPGSGCVTGGDELVGVGHGYAILLVEDVDKLVVNVSLSVYVVVELEVAEALD